MRKRLIAAFILFSLIIHFTCTFSYAAPTLSLSASSAVLITADTKEVLYSKNAYEKRGIASTTKIMSAVVALEYGNPDMSVTVNSTDALVEGTSIGLKSGDRVPLLTLIKGMLLESGNDAANVTATAVSGSKEAFLRLMNERAKSLGMSDTNFENPSGLPDENHYSTAYDMALLGAFAVSLPEFAEICSQKSMRVSYGTPECEHTFTNHNKLLTLYEGAFGIKTGFTKLSGRCLVSGVKKDGITLIAVTLNAPDDWNDHIKLFDYGFSAVKKVEYLKEPLKAAVGGSNKKEVLIKAVPEYFCADKNTAYTVELLFEDTLFAPVKRGDIVGKAVVKNKDGKALCEAELVSQGEAAARGEGLNAPKAKGKTLFEKITAYFKNKIRNVKEKFN